MNKDAESGRRNSLKILGLIVGTCSGAFRATAVPLATNNEKKLSEQVFSSPECFAWGTRMHRPSDASEKLRPVGPAVVANGILGGVTTIEMSRVLYVVISEEWIPATRNPFAPIRGADEIRSEYSPRTLPTSLVNVVNAVCRCRKATGAAPGCEGSASPSLAAETGLPWFHTG